MPSGNVLIGCLDTDGGEGKNRRSVGPAPQPSFQVFGLEIYNCGHPSYEAGPTQGCECYCGTATAAFETSVTRCNRESGRIVASIARAAAAAAAFAGAPVGGTDDAGVVISLRHLAAWFCFVLSCGPPDSLVQEEQGVAGLAQVQPITLNATPKPN